MSDCCTPSGYDRLFDEKEARKNLRQYRKKGLDHTARVMADYLVTQDMTGNSVLEIGGGIGSLHVELLKAGAERAVNVDISPEYEAAALELLTDEELTDRVQREVTDFAQAAESFAVVDDVVMNRVICCYPHMEQLVGAACRHSRRFMAASFPRRHWFRHVTIGVENWIHRLRRIDFRVYLHKPEDIVATAERHGFTPVFQNQNIWWQTVVFRRVA